MAGTSPNPPGGAVGGRPRPGFELSLERGRAVVRLADQVFLPGVRLAELLLDVPGVRFPFDAGAGAAQFRQHLCDLDRLEVVADGEAARGLAARLDLRGTGLGGMDSVGTLFIAVLCFREGREAFRKAKAGSFACACGGECRKTEDR